MNLQPINPPLANDRTVQCCVCLKMKHDAMADLHGKPFQAYYCLDCIAVSRESHN